MNAKLKLDLYKIDLPNDLLNTMVVGVAVVNAGRKTIIGLTATYSKHLT